MAEELSSVIAESDVMGPAREGETVAGELSLAIAESDVVGPAREELSASAEPDVVEESTVGSTPADRDSLAVGTCKI